MRGGTLSVEGLRGSKPSRVQDEQAEPSEHEKEYLMQRTKLCAVLVVVSIGWWLSGAVIAKAPKGSGTDQQFLQKAASDGRTEVQLGTMASTQAASPEVQQFGQPMVTDHTKANQELMALAQ